MTHPITVRGQSFPSLAACAEYFKLCPSTVAKARELGREDFIGQGRNAPQPCVIDGVTYPSIQAASRETGINLSTLQRAIVQQIEPKKPSVSQPVVGHLQTSSA